MPSGLPGRRLRRRRPWHLRGRPLRGAPRRAAELRARAEKACRDQATRKGTNGVSTTGVTAKIRGNHLSDTTCMTHALFKSGENRTGRIRQVSP